MEYFSSDRPRGLSGRLCYTDPEGRLVAAIPDLCLSPTEQFKEDGQRIWKVSVMLLMGTVTGRQFISPILESGVSALLERWVADPEWVMREYFGYQGYHRPAPIAAAKTNTTLEELGL